MKAVLLRETRISQVFGVDKATLLTQNLYHPDFVNGLVDLPDNAEPGKYWVDGTIVDRLPVIASEVTEERDNRMGTLVFQGKEYSTTGVSLENIMGAGTLALAAMVNGAQVGDYRWADPESDFVWIANDNSLNLMDAQTVWAFATAAAEWRKKMIYAARALKDMDPIPMDFASNNSYWGV